MPVTTPNRVADPVILESFEAPCLLKQEGGLFIPYFNKGPNSLIAGEPIVALGRVCIVQRTILPGEMGTLVADWIVEAILNPAHSGDINEGDLIYWNTALNAVKSQVTGAVVSGIGAAAAAVPTNGFILGRACGPFSKSPPVDGSGDLVCATTGSKRVMVVNVPGAPTTYSG